MSGPESAREVAHLADGVVVGSAMIRHMQSSTRPARAAAAFVRSLKEAIGAASCAPR